MSLDELIQDAKDIKAKKAEAIEGCKQIIEAFGLLPIDLFTLAVPVVATSSEGKKGKGGEGNFIYAIKDENTIFGNSGKWKDRLAANPWVKVEGGAIASDPSYYLTPKPMTKTEALAAFKARSTPEG